MDGYYLVGSVLLVVLVLIVGFVAVSMFLPVYERGGGSTSCSSTCTGSVSTASQAPAASSGTSSSVSSTISTTSTLLTAPPPGSLRVDSYDIRVESGTIRVGLVLKNTYPVEVIIERIYLNDTLVYRGPRVIDPWSQVTRIAGGDTGLAASMSSVWINTGIKPAPGSELLICGKTVTIGNITIIYTIPGVEGTYNLTLPLKLPECIINNSFSSSWFR